jgi:hypothetical protein
MSCILFESRYKRYLRLLPTPLIGGAHARRPRLLLPLPPSSLIVAGRYGRGVAMCVLLRSNLLPGPCYGRPMGR